MIHQRHPVVIRRMLAARLIFSSVLLLLIIVLVSAFVLTGPMGWSIGLLYIGYDSWLLWYMVRTSRQAILKLQGHESPQTSLPRVSVIISACNERQVLPACLDALLKQTDAADEVIIIDDGSTDSSIDWLTDEWKFQFSGKLGISRVQPSLKVWRKEHSGKGASLNEVWPAALGDVVITLDADTMLESDAIAEIRQAFARNQNLAATCGILVPKCRGKFWARIFEFYQRFEYHRGFLWRMAWTKGNTLMLISGAFAAYRKEVLFDLNGFNPNSIVEDYDLIYRLHRFAHENQRQDLQVQIAGTARATTDSPANAQSFLRQRARWFSGFLQTLFRNGDMVANSRYGRIGRFMLPIKTIDTLLPVYALFAAVVLVAFITLGRRVDKFIIAVLIAKALFDLTFHCWAIVLYQRWQNIPLTRMLWAKSLLATLTEPFVFQILRHLGAMLGWIYFLRGKMQWQPQRP